MRRALVVLALLIVVACAPAAAAHHKPNHHKPGHGTTTTMPITTTTPTTVPVCSPGTPITVSSATVLRGCYRSTNPAVPAITIETDQLVELDHARIEHAGAGVHSTWPNTRLNIHDSTFQKLPSTLGAATEQRAVYAYATVRLNFDYNKLIDGDGVRWTSDLATDPEEQGSFTHNEVWNVGRYQPTELVQAFTLTTNTIVPDIEVAWNKITNIFGQSDVEDVISFITSGGTTGHRAQVHHNLVDGAYPLVTGVHPFTGTAINVGDGPGGPGGSSFVDAHHNWCLAYSNVGIAVSGGTDHEVYNNVVISTGRVNGIISGADFGAGIYDNFGTNNVNKFIHDNTIGHLRPVDADTLERFDVYFPSAASPFDVYDAADDAVHTPNTFMSPDPDDADYQQARADWEAARVAAGQTVGPRP